MTHPDSPRYPVPYSDVTREREQVVEALCVHFAQDDIGMESLEQRLSMAYASQTTDELRDALAGLPSLDKAVRELGRAPVPVSTASVPERGAALAIMGGVVRKGSWYVPRHLRVLAIMGGAEIDLREAKFGPGVTEIEVHAYMGGVEITVPPGVRVESLGAAFMGGFETSAGDVSMTDDPMAPVLRISGLAIMGGVEVRVRRTGKKTLARFQAALYAAGLASDLEEDVP